MCDQHCRFISCLVTYVGALFCVNCNSVIYFNSIVTCLVYLKMQKHVDNSAVNFILMRSKRSDQEWFFQCCCGCWGVPLVHLLFFQRLQQPYAFPVPYFVQGCLQHATSRTTPQFFGGSFCSFSLAAVRYSK